MKKNKVLVITSLIALLVFVVLGTYAYFVATSGTPASTDITITSNTVDSLMFETGSNINITADQDTFAKGEGNLSDTTYAKATLKANNKTNEVHKRYYVYYIINHNTFKYSTIANKAEILLKVKKNNIELTHDIVDLEYTSVVDGEGNTLNGYDITKTHGIIELALEEDIEVLPTNATHQTIDTWDIEIIFVNLDANQTINAGAIFDSELIIQEVEIPTLHKTYDESETGENYVDGTYIGEIWNVRIRPAITSITFEDTSADRSDADIIYDISDAQNGSIMAYMYDNGESTIIYDMIEEVEVETNTYTVYIQSKSLKIALNKDSSDLFAAFVNLLSINNLDVINTSQVTNMYGMFANCNSLTTLDLSSFDTSNVTDMTGMFADCQSLLDLNLSNFDTSNVTDMEGMFANCQSLLDLNLSNFDTSQVTNMKGMFSGCSSLTRLNVSNFDLSSIEDADDMFYVSQIFESDNPNFIFDISNWPIQSVQKYYSAARSHGEKVIVKDKECLYYIKEIRGLSGLTICINDLEHCEIIPNQ